jgi:nucleoside-diphosphate kinase
VLIKYAGGEASFGGKTMKKTFMMVKPDGVQRGLIGEVVSRFEKKGFQLIGAKLMMVSRELAEKHYEEHRERPFFAELVDFITSGPVFAMVWQGDQIITVSRQMMGKTNPAEASSGTIRGDFAVNVAMNIIHGSDSPESAKRELALWFREEEQLPFARTMDRWI